MSDIGASHPPIMTAGDISSLRIALACPGVGLVQRGFERFFYDLFEVTQHQFDVTLFKGGGNEADRERVPLFVHRNSRVLKLLPFHWIFGRSPMHSECLTFGLAILAHIARGSFDVVHTIDPPLARLLFYLRDRLKLSFRLLYTEGCAMPPGHYPPADHIQQISQVTFDEAVAFGHRPEKMTLLPLGIHPERFVVNDDRSSLRKSYGLADDTFVILSVAAINRKHKRIDHLIDEAARLEGNFLLWLDGSLDHGDPDLLDYARAKLGARCRITHVPSKDVGKLYRLADIMVHSASFEAFGLAVVEAAACGLPVLTHNAPHFQWLLPNPRCWFDTYQPGALAERLIALMRQPSRLPELQVPEITRERFSWNRLAAGYGELYQRVAHLPAGSRRVAVPSAADRGYSDA